MLSITSLLSPSRRSSLGVNRFICSALTFLIREKETGGVGSSRGEGKREGNSWFACREKPPSSSSPGLSTHVEINMQKHASTAHLEGCEVRSAGHVASSGRGEVSRGQRASSTALGSEMSGGKKAQRSGNWFSLYDAFLSITYSFLFGWTPSPKTRLLLLQLDLLNFPEWLWTNPRTSPERASF